MHVPPSSPGSMVRREQAEVAMKPASQARNDIFGGLVSAAVAIPLAMGYGMFALSALGEYYFADGALAGLATAFVVAIVCVVLGDRTTTVYAPRINSTFFLGILIYGLVHSDSEAIAAGGTPFILAIAFAVMIARRCARGAVRPGQ